MSSSSVSRRSLLGGAAAALAGCRKRAGLTSPAPAVRAHRVAPVHVARERVIRTVVGLRPFRPSGFVVRAEKLDEKLVIHNYGHGGAGITLSWGTAQLAVDLAAGSEARECAVIGCGVVGLSTARLLQLRGYRPVIYARDMPPSTTSNIAGGLWDPVTVYDHDRVAPGFRRQFGEAARFAFQRYQLLAGSPYGVRWMPIYSLSQTGPHQPAPPESPNAEVEPLYPEARQLPPAENPFPVAYAWLRYSMLIEPSIYLTALLRDFELAGGRVQIREFSSARELSTLPQSLLFNCTGLGARALFQDEELIPIRGQLTFLLPQPEVDYMTVGPGDIYMFPRQDGILLGGTHDRNVWNTDVDPATIDRVLRENSAVLG